MKNRSINIFSIIFLVISISCSFTSPISTKKIDKTSTPGASRVIEKTVTQIAIKSGKNTAVANQPGIPSIGQLVFCSDVDPNTGDPIDPSESFPADTMTVTVVFTFENMQDGMLWTLDMFRDDYKMRGESNEKWSDGENGWVAYELAEDLSNNPLAGNYSVKISLGDQVVQEGSFKVAYTPIEKNSFPSFGPVQFAKGITDEVNPVDAATTFDEGIEEVFAVFPFSNMKPDQAYSREWLLDGEVTARKDLTWDEQEDGITYASLHTQGGMKPGKYTLNLYVGEQIARSSNFEILAAPTPIPPEDPTQIPDLPSKPEEIIDPQVMPTWQYLANFNNESVSGAAQIILSDHIKIKVDPSYNGLASFSYVCSTQPPKYAGDVGEIKISPRFLNETSRVELAGAILHEITHARQRVNGMKCGCTVEKEYHAYSVQGGFWVLAGAQNLLTDYVGDDIFDSLGHFDKNKFWNAVKKIYKNCEDY